MNGWHTVLMMVSQMKWGSIGNESTTVTVQRSLSLWVPCINSPTMLRAPSPTLGDEDSSYYHMHMAVSRYHRMLPMANKHCFMRGRVAPVPGLLITLCSIRHVPPGAWGRRTPACYVIAWNTPEFYTKSAFGGRAAPGTTLDTNRMEPAARNANPAVNDSRNRCTTRAPIRN